MKCYENKSMSVDLKAINFERERVLFAELWRASSNFTEISARSHSTMRKSIFYWSLQWEQIFPNFTEIVDMMESEWNKYNSSKHC